MLVLALSTLTLVLTDVQSRPLDTAALREATEAALLGSSVALRWERAEPRTGRPRQEGEARVILLPRHPRRGSQRVLGAVFREPKRSRAIWLYVEDVREVLRLEGANPGADGVRRLSIALGRVLAHEVAHLLAPDQPHSDQGLMARAVDRAVLSREGGALDAGCLAAIRAATAPGGPVGPELPARPGLAMLAAPGALTLAY